MKLLVNRGSGVVKTPKLIGLRGSGTVRGRVGEWVMAEVSLGLYNHLIINCFGVDWGVDMGKDMGYYPEACLSNVSPDHFG